MKPDVVTLLTLLTASLACQAAGGTQVKVFRPARGEVFRFVTLPGTIKANQQATLYAKVGGYLTSLTVDKGDAVEAGQTLGQIEVPELIAERVQHAAAANVAELDFERLSHALEEAPDLVVPRTVDEARGRMEIARANLERTETLLRYARLTAPFAGRVIARYVDPGAFVPSATSGSAADSAAVVTIADFSTVRVQAPVPAAEALRVKVGQPVEVAVEGVDDRRFPGTVSRHAYALDYSTQTLLAEADLPNPDQLLRPGMFATVRIGVERHAGVLTIPAETLVKEKSRSFVFVATNGRAKKTPVTTGFNDGRKVEIVEGVTTADWVIRVDAGQVSDGAAIEIVEEP